MLEREVPVENIYEDMIVRLIGESKKKSNFQLQYKG
jgi:hypothetical protein